MKNWQMWCGIIILIVIGYLVIAYSGAGARVNMAVNSVGPQRDNIGGVGLGTPGAY